jgi:hypothetical protein
MALPAQRHEEIDASLQRIHRYLTALAAELDTATTNEQGETYQIALTVAAWVTQLRHALKTDQEQPQSSQSRPRPTA